MKEQIFADFSAPVWAQIRAAVRAEKEVNPAPVAAFDADGTLWDTDLGENFFRYQIREKLVPLPENPWRHYRDWKEGGDPRPAYLWLAQINAGVSIDRVRGWAKDAVDSIAPVPVFPAQRQLIDLLQTEGVRVFIVTASVKWAVEAGAHLLGLEPENVLGYETKVGADGIVTTAASGHSTYRQGKIEAVLAASGGVAPFLSAGNSFGDIAILEGATKIRLAVTANHPGDELFKAEDDLQREAEKRGWLRHRFK